MSPMPSQLFSMSTSILLLVNLFCLILALLVFLQMKPVFLLPSMAF